MAMAYLQPLYGMRWRHQLANQRDYDEDDGVNCYVDDPGT